ncbi:ALATS [Symbiodinium natans]|uniref:ALATS protein n=1 Tax=Symbiodinium natans TaxID=878477 RepID=A0A812U6I8_9DINO|nr:ALATS [Symbiodinium natans]
MARPSCKPSLNLDLWKNRPRSPPAPKPAAARSRSPRRHLEDKSKDGSWTSWTQWAKEDDWPEEQKEENEKQHWAVAEYAEPAGSRCNQSGEWSKQSWSWSEWSEWSEWSKNDRNDRNDRHDRHDRNDRNDRNERGWARARPQKEQKELKELYAQAYISDIPVEFDAQHLNKMHSECGILEGDFPVSVKFLPSKDSTGETCSCIARYRNKDTMELVIMRMNGKILTTRSGKVKRAGVSAAKPARWMVQAGLAKQGTDSWTPRKVSVQNVPKHYTVEDVLKLHKSQGIDVQELPTVYFHNPKKEGSETCSVTCKYDDITHAQNAMQKIGGLPVTTASGQELRLVPVLVDQNGLEDKPESFRFDEGVDLEGVIHHWNEVQGYGFIRPVQPGPDLFVHRSEIPLPEGQLPPLWSKVRFQVSWVPDRGKQEACRIRFVDPEPMTLALKAGGAGGVGGASERPHCYEHYERHPGLDYFCQTWGLDSATSAWLERLHPDVQQELINEYDDSTRMDFPNYEDYIEMVPSTEVLLANVPRTSESALTTLLQRFGRVCQTRFLPSGRAVVTMTSIEEATMAVEDLTFRIPEGWRNLLACFHHESPPVPPSKIPEGKMLFGVVKSWNHLMQTGVVALFGIGPDLDVHSSALLDSYDLIPASAALFRVAKGPARIFVIVG